VAGHSPACFGLYAHLRAGSLREIRNRDEEEEKEWKE
jgi:hypothetical protein